MNKGKTTHVGCHQESLQLWSPGAVACAHTQGCEGFTPEVRVLSSTGGGSGQRLWEKGNIQGSFCWEVTWDVCSSSNGLYKTCVKPCQQRTGCWEPRSLAGSIAHHSPSSSIERVVLATSLVQLSRVPLGILNSFSGVSVASWSVVSVNEALWLDFGNVMLLACFCCVGICVMHDLCICWNECLPGFAFSFLSLFICSLLYGSS